MKCMTVQKNMTKPMMMKRTGASGDSHGLSGVQVKKAKSGKLTTQMTPKRNDRKMTGMIVGTMGMAMTPRNARMMSMNMALMTRSPRSG